MLTGCYVTIDDKGGKGTITIEYQNLNDFDRVMGWFDISDKKKN